LDPANPFLYSKEDLLKIYKDGGGRGGLGLEVERWEGVVREVGSEPISLKEWTEGQRKVHLISVAHFGVTP
jgi:PERQ amino acid-rich with GYF domain-containing protein